MSKFEDNPEKTGMCKCRWIHVVGSVALFPTKALIRLLGLLPQDLPVFHFGDTDPAGFHILSKLRETSKRPVRPFLMARRSSKKKCPLSEYDQAILPRLLSDPLLNDVVMDIQLMEDSGCKGDFEQETIGPPDLEAWPFFNRYRTHRAELPATA